MLAHNYNFEGTYNDLEKLHVFVFEVRFPGYVHLYFVNNNLVYKINITKILSYIRIIIIPVLFLLYRMSLIFASILNPQ